MTVAVPSVSQRNDGSKARGNAERRFLQARRPFFIP